MKYIISLSISSMFIFITILICREYKFNFNTISIAVGWNACLIHRATFDWLNKKIEK